MKKYTFIPFLCILLFAGNVMISCNGSSSTSSSSEDSSKTAKENNGSSTVRLEKQWETDTSNALLAPESALWDAQQQLFYVSNINSGGSDNEENGFISQVNAEGKIVTLHWADGLDDPKGLGMYQGTLYAADVDQLVIIDMANGKIKQKVSAPGATFLNDVATDDEGNVYISDTRQGKVYRYADGKISVYLDQPEMKGANGLLVWHGKLWILTSGGIYTYDESNEKLTLFSDGVKGGDGLAAVNDSDLIASRWVGEVYYVHANGKAVKLLDTKDANKNTADICYVPELQLLAVPTFGGNTLAGYKVVVNEQ
jgi:hypothetical protein